MLRYVLVLVRGGPVLLALASLVAAQAGRVPDRPQDSAAFLAAHTGPLPALSADAASRIDTLLRQMTAKEKVGQMTQLEIGMITDGSGDAVHVDPAKLRKAVVDYGAGEKSKYIDAFLDNVAWEVVEQRFKDSRDGHVPARF